MAYIRFGLPIRLSIRAIVSARFIGSVSTRVSSALKRVTAAKGVRSASSATVALPSARR